MKTFSVFFFSAVLGLSGCRAKAVIPVGSGNTIASPSASVSLAASFTPATSQPAWADNKLTAGDHSPQVPVTATFSGSGWPLALVSVAMLAACLVGCLTWFWLRERRDRQVTDGNALGVAQAIADSPDGPHREMLLSKIHAALPDRAAWNTKLDAHGLRLYRQKPFLPLGMRD